MNPKIVALQIRLDLFDNSWIIRVKRNDNPINSQILFCKIKNGYYPIFLVFVLKGDLWELGETKGKGTFPEMLARTRFTLSSRLTYTLVVRSKNQQVVEMENMKESQKPLKWPYLMNECRDLLKRLQPLIRINPLPHNTWPRKW